MLIFSKKNSSLHIADFDNIFYLKASYGFMIFF